MIKDYKNKMVSNSSNKRVAKKAKVKPEDSHAEKKKELKKKRHEVSPELLKIWKKRYGNLIEPEPVKKKTEKEMLNDEKYWG